MASSDLYYNSSKEKDRLMKNNIRSRAGSGGLNSNESQYSNYLQNLKPKDKKENNQKNHHNNDIHSSSFVESAARASSINSRKDVNKTKSDPTPHKKSKPTPVQQQKTEESEATVVDVGKLRSFFDRAADENNPSISNVPRRPGSRPNSVSFDDNKIKNFDINKFLRKDDEDVKSSNKTNESSEFLTFEDNVVPTGSKTIDINSILVASPSQAEEKKISKTEEKETNKIKTAKEPAKNELSFEKRLQLERIKRAAEEQAIEQKYSFKRRSLKERLNDMLTEDERIEAEANRIQAESGITAEFNVDVEEPETKEIVSISDTTYNVTPDNVPETNNTYTVAKEEIPLPNNATYNVESDSTYTLEENDASNLLRKTDSEETFVVKHAEETFSENIVSERKNEIDDSDTETLVLDSEDANGLLYKSALERFEEFIHQEEQKPVILSPTTEKNLEEVEEFVKNNKYKDEVKDSASEASGEESDTDLMNSILKHMETSTDIEKDDIKKFNGEQGDLSNSNIADVSAVTDSKLEESEVNATAETTTETELAADDKDTTNHDLTMTHHDDTTSSHITTDDSDEESSENEYTIEHFLDPPAKSNLAGAERKPKRNVIFNDNKLTETILTYGPSEYDRANADIDPIASSAEWELEKRVDKMDIFSVDLQKDGKGLGLSIIGLGVGTETGVEKLGIFVKTLTDGGASQKDGRIQVNDQILEVNGISLVGVTQSFAAQTLKGTSGVVRFLMGREKSRRTQFAPGSALADNPEVQQHMEEMRQALQQLEEFEDRALNAESTVEEIKQELLKAEERAHGAEQALAETKDKLSAVKESPFTNNRKLKNEIKSKKGSKGSDAKVDELQKNLKDVTSRLSVSEDNLLQLSSEYGSKEKQLDHLQQEVATNSQIVEDLENANRKLKDDLAGKQGKVEAATKQTEKLQNELNELKGKIEKERKAFKDQAGLFNEQSDSVQKLFEQKYSELEKKNQSLEDELEILKRREQEANKSREEIQRSLEKLQSETDKLKAADETGALKTAVDTKENDIKKLWEENDKLRISNNLIKANLDELSSQHRQLELLNEKEKQAGEEERQQLNSKIIELEAKLKETELHRNIQVVDQVQVESPPTDLFELPEVITIRKSTAEPSTGEDLDKSSAESEVSFPPVEIKRPEESSVEKINPHQVSLVELESSPKVSLDTSPVLPEVALESKQDIASENDLTHDNTEVVSTKLPVDRPTIEESIIGLPETSVEVECAPTIETLPITDQNMTSSKEKIKIDTNSNEVISNEDPIDEKLSEIKCAEISATQPLPEAEAKSSLLDEINVAVLSRGESITVTTKRLSAQEFDSLPEANIDSVSNEDPLSEDTTGDVPQASVVKNLSSKVENAEKPSNDSSVDGAADSKRLSRASKEEDEGQFSIVAEQVEEEPEEKRMVQLQEQQKLSIDLAIGELKQLNSFDKDEKAEEIAAQVISESPTKKRHTSYGSSDEESDAPQPLEVSGMSSTSTLLSNNMDRKASVKIDAHYFQKSPPAEITDVEVSILDDEEENADDREDLSRNDSFSVIPYTVVLDNQYSAHKRDVKSPKRRPPTKGTAGKLAENIDEFQLNRSADDIPMDSAKLQQQSQAAVSLPNLISPATHNHVEKEKQSKSKFTFHIPKVFKKNKGSSVSHENLVSQSPSAASTPIDPPPTLAESHSEDAILHSENNNNKDSEVVPLSEKLEYHAQQQANDAATEEAVVPFAQMIETNGPAMTTPSSSSKDNFKLELQASLASKLKQETFNERAVNAVNERPIDIGEAPPSTNVEQPPPAEVMQKEIIDWDIRQVGIWLVETNMSQYVEGFKSHKVDGHTLINADGNTLKEYGVTNHEHRAEIKKRVKELKNRMTKASFNKGKARTSKGKLSFWKGKYKVAN